MRIHDLTDTEKDELNEIWPAAIPVAAQIAKHAPKIAKAVSKAYDKTFKKAKIGKSAEELGGSPRTLPGGRAIAHGGARQTVDKVNTVTKAVPKQSVSKTQSDWLSGKKLPPNAKPMSKPKATTKKVHTKKGKHTSSNADGVNYSAGGRYTQGIPKKNK